MIMNEDIHSKLNRRRRRKKQLAINVRLKKYLLDGKEFGVCCYCLNAFGVKDLTIEHKVPICLGGTSDLSNVDLACAPCNQKRGREAWLYKKKINREMAKDARQKQNQRII